MECIKIIREAYDATGVIGGGEPIAGRYLYLKNNFGIKFLDFISSKCKRKGMD